MIDVWRNEDIVLDDAVNEAIKKFKTKDYGLNEYMYEMDNILGVIGKAKMQDGSISTKAYTLYRSLYIDTLIEYNKTLVGDNE